MAVKFMVVNFMDINFVAMNYYDREIPLKQLKAIRDKAFESFSKMTVLKGRRRIGKTTLGTLAFEGADFVYLFVGRRSESDLCEDFSSEIRRVLGVFVPEGITRFKDIFGLLMSAGETRSFTLFIDEVQEFYYINKAVFSDIQDIWDRTRRKTHVNLVFSGSTFTLMEKIFKDEHEPLFGRADLTLELEPFSTSVQKSILADHKADYNNDDLLALYCFTGGVPKYIELLMDNGCLNLDSMVDYMTTPGSQFLDEGEKILIQEMGKNYGTYFSILARISSGEVTLPEIEGSLGDKSLGGQIRILEEEYKLISKKRPIRSGENSKDVRYEISDVFLRFWFRYFHRYRSLVEIKNYSALANIIKEDYPTYSGRILERWFRERMMESQKYSEIGGWWNPTKGKKGIAPNELDLVGVALDGTVKAFEVKRNKSKYSPLEVEAKVRDMSNKVFGGKEVVFSCLSIEDM